MKAESYKTSLITDIRILQSILNKDIQDFSTLKKYNIGELKEIKHKLYLEKQEKAN